MNTGIVKYDDGTCTSMVEGVLEDKIQQTICSVLMEPLKKFQRLVLNPVKLPIQ